MKKLLATMMCLVLLGLTAMPAAAQKRRQRKQQATVQRQYDDERGRYEDTNYEDVGYEDVGYEDNRSIWEKHRDKITTAGGAVGGAVLGGLLGGKKGAIIGAIAGGAGSAIYTYKIRKKDQRY